MTQGKVSAMNKTTTEGTMPTAPPSYEEATAGGSSPCYSEGYHGDREMLTEWGWHDQNIRRIFIRKVYTMLMTQLLVTLAIVALFTFCDPVKIYIQANPGWYWASYAVFFITYLTLSCCPGPRRRFPWNLILLVVFTLSLSYMTGMLSSDPSNADALLTVAAHLPVPADVLLSDNNCRGLAGFYNTKSVMICLGITAMVCLSVTVFSFQTKTDITSCQGVLFVLCMTMFFCGIMLSIVLPFGYVPLLHAIYAAMGAILFTMFLAFDTQLLMGNKRYAISPEEYIFATLNIYLDIVYLFSFVLQIFGSERD